MPLIQALPTPTPTPTQPLHHQQPQQQQQQQHSNEQVLAPSKQLAKSMPVTPIQPQSPTDPTAAHFMLMPRSPSYELYETREPIFRHAHSDATFRMQPYDNDDDDDDDNNNDDDLDDDDAEETSSLAMITPPPPYDTPQLAIASLGATSAAPLPPPRRFRFGNRELFSMSPGTPKSNAITPTKLSAAAAAVFATPQMAQLNRKWAHLQRKRRRRNSSNGDSKELDKLVLQSVDWDENEMY